MQICALSPNPDKNVIHAYGTEKQLSMHPIKEMSRRNNNYSACSSEICPLNSFDIKNDDICDMTLHRPDEARKDVGLIEQAIREFGN